MRQVSYMMHVIDKKQHSELALQAKLHGFKRKGIDAEPVLATKTQREEYNTQAEETLKRMQQEHISRKLNDGR